MAPHHGQGDCKPVGQTWPMLIENLCFRSAQRLQIGDAPASYRQQKPVGNGVNRMVWLGWLLQEEVTDQPFKVPTTPWEDRSQLGFDPPILQDIPHMPLQRRDALPGHGVKVGVPDMGRLVVDVPPDQPQEGGIAGCR